MIHIFDKYYAKADQDQIVIGVPKTRINKDGNEETVLTNPGYYGSLDNAIKGVYKRLEREVIQGADGELKDALQAISQLNQAFTESIQKAIPNINEVVQAIGKDTI